MQLTIAANAAAPAGCGCRACLAGGLFLLVQVFSSVVFRFFQWCGRNQGLRFAVFVLCVTVFCYGVFRPQPPPELFQDSDKLWHVLAFIGLSFSTRLAFPRISGWLLWPALFGLAPLVEGLQQWLQASRHFSLGDIQANLLGVLVSLLLFSAIYLLRRRESANA